MFDCTGFGKHGQVCSKYFGATVMSTHLRKIPSLPGAGLAIHDKNTPVATGVASGSGSGSTGGKSSIFATILQLGSDGNGNDFKLWTDNPPTPVKHATRIC